MTSLNFCFGGFPPSLHPHILTTTNPLHCPLCLGWVGHWREKLGRGRSGDKITDHTYTRSVNMKIRNILLKLSFRILWQDTIINKIVCTTPWHHYVVDCRPVSFSKCLSIYNFISIIAHWMLHSAGHYYLRYEGYLLKWGLVTNGDNTISLIAKTPLKALY